MSAAPRVLLVGCRGQLGWELRRALAALAELVCTESAEPAPDRVLDLGDRNAIDRLLDEVRPAVVVNAAAYTDVAGAERDRETATRINGEAPGWLACAADRVGATLVHYSTDFVFDGAAQRPYREDDPARPLNHYGASKLAGEHAIAAASARYFVLRTSWLYAARGRNFVRTVLARALAGDVLRVVDDQRGAPTSARHLAECSARVVARILDGGDPFARAHAGVYHLAASGECSWYELATAVLGAFPSLATDLRRISTADYPDAVARPAYSVLSSARAERLFGVRAAPWREQLDPVLEEIAASMPT